MKTMPRSFSINFCIINSTYLLPVNHLSIHILMVRCFYFITNNIFIRYIFQIFDSARNELPCAERLPSKSC